MLPPPWSTMSARKERWLSEATLPALTWAYSTRYRKPAGVIHENAPGWDDQPTMQIFCGSSRKRNLASLFSDVGRDAHRSDLEGDLCLQPPALCPTDLGRPSRRKRKYTLWLLKRTLKLNIPPSTCFFDIFQDIFYRTMESTAAVYRCAPDELVARHNCAGVERQGFQVHPADVTGSMALTPGPALRLSGFEELAAKRGILKDGVWQVGVALVNITHRPGFIKQIDCACAPALMRRSDLFDLVTSRELVGPEYWAIQGYPHPDMIRSALSTAFPFSDMDLTLTQVRHLTGNGMHLACVGAMLAFFLGCTLLS